VVVDTLPDGFVVVSSVPAYSSISGQQITWNVVPCHQYSKIITLT